MPWKIVPPPPGSPGSYSFPSMPSQPGTPTTSLSPTSLRASAPTRHPDYYFDDGNIVFQVEETLFRVHRHFFVRDSVKFHDMLSILHPSGTSTVDGTSDERPMVLPQVKAGDFQHLLWMFYNPMITTYKASVDEWCAILALADRWEMETIKRVAIEEIGKLPMDPIEKITLGLKYGVDNKWALEAYCSLCTRDGPLNLEEGRRLGVDVLALIAAAREQVILPVMRTSRSRTISTIPVPPTPNRKCRSRSASRSSGCTSRSQSRHSGWGTWLRPTRPFEDIVMDTVVLPLNAIAGL